MFNSDMERAVAYRKLFSGEGEWVLEDILNNICNIDKSGLCLGDKDQTVYNATIREVGLVIEGIVNADLEKLRNEENTDEQNV